MLSDEELGARLEATKRQLEEITAEAGRNEDKMRRSQQREFALLQADDLQSLFHEMTVGLRVSYGLQYVSVVLCDPDHDIRHLLLAAGSPVEEIDNLIVVESLSGLAPQYIALRRPWLGRYTGSDHQLIFPGSADIKSVAMVPLLHRRKLIGSINFGSSDALRYTRAHASDFLAHLGTIASYCVENVVNRSRLLRSGFTDVLTGWHNRRYLQVRIKEELARAQRDGANLVCLMLDVDHFKRVNDTWGHAAGDAVLRELSQRIETQVRASDVAARYGGEEFVIVLPNTDTEHGVRLAERIRSAISAVPIQLPNGEEIQITVSIGIAGISPPRNDSDLKTLGDALIARADVALYSAKSGGRDRVLVENAA
jgi:two-component system cell cycle response regulator